MKRFLIVKTSSLGDIIHTFPVIDYLKSHIPNCFIDWVVEKPFCQLIESHPLINNVICIDTKKWRKSPFSRETRYECSEFRFNLRKKRYDIIFDLQGNLKSGLVALQAKTTCRVGIAYNNLPEVPNLLCPMKRYRFPQKKNVREDLLSIIKQHFKDERSFVSKPMSLNLTKKESEAIDTLMSPFKNENLILVCPFSRWKNKQLPPQDLIRILNQISESQKTHLLFCPGSEKEKQETEIYQKMISNSSSILPKLSYSVLQAIIRRVSLVVAMDSLPLHLAGTTSTPTLSFFGPSNGWKYCPTGPQNQYIQGNCPYGIQFEKRCPKLRTCPTGSCMHNLSIPKSV